MKPLNTFLLRFVLFTLVLFLLVIQTPLAQDTDPVKTRLLALGVDVDEGPRVIEIGNAGARQSVALPETYAPLGNAYTVNRTAEIGFLNLAPESNKGLTFSMLDDKAENYKNLIGTDPATKHAPTLNTYSQRFVTYGDLNKDGLDEVILLYKINTGTKFTLHMQVLYNIDPTTIDGQTPTPLPPNTQAYKSFLFLNVYEENLAKPEVSKLDELTVATGDINGDGSDEVVLVVCCQTVYNNLDTVISRNVEVVALSVNGIGATSGTPSLTQLLRRDLPNLTLNKTVYPELAIGSVDADVASEMVIVLNERTEDPQTDASADGNARYVVLDDSSTTYNQVNAGVVSEFIGGVTRTALLANVAIGDVDGDGFNEILFAGLTDFSHECVARYVFIAKDDALHGFAALGASFEEVIPVCNVTNGFAKVRYVQMSTLDIDGNGTAEVQVNGMVYSGWKQQTPAPWTKLFGVSSSGIFLDSSNRNFVKANSAIVTGNFIANDPVTRAEGALAPSEEILFYSPVQSKVSIYGIDPTTGLFGELDSLSYSRPGGDSEFYPALIAPDVDQDATVLRFVEHKVYYTEPIIIAVVAAAPCNPEWAQDVGNCTTSFGDSQSSGQETEKLIGMEASVTVGYSFEDPFGVFGAEVSASLSGFMNEAFGEVYSRTDTRLYTTVGLEDMVIFTSVPVDRYVYELVSCDPQLPPPGQSGGQNDFCLLDDPTTIQFNVDLPRDPQTIPVSLDFYNDLVPEGGKAVSIDSSIISHRPGDPSSYLTETEKATILANNPGVESKLSPPTTGQGSNFTTDTIEIGTETSYTTTEGFSYEFAFAATAGGFMAGFSVGFTQEDSLTITTGQSAIYEASVASHQTSDPANYEKWKYKYGMFAYQHTAFLPGVAGPNNVQRFQVINFWTESQSSSGWPPTSTPTASLTPTQSNGTPAATVTGTPPTAAPTVTGTPPTPTLQPTPDGSVELLVNTSFEDYDATSKQPSTWVGKDVGITNKVKCNKPDKTFAHSGLCAYGFKGTGVRVQLSQAVPEATLSASGAIEGAELSAVIYASGKNVPAGSASVRVKIKYTDPTAGDKENGKDKLSFNLDLTADNQYQSFEAVLIFDSVPNNLRFQVRFLSPSGKLYIDDASASVPSGSAALALPGENGRSN
jgi:hypothetical protein